MSDTTAIFLAGGGGGGGAVVVGGNGVVVVGGGGGGAGGVKRYQPPAATITMITMMRIDCIRVIADLLVRCRRMFEVLSNSSHTTFIGFKPIV